MDTTDIAGVVDGGLVASCMGTIDVGKILEYLQGKPVTIQRLAAFSHAVIYAGVTNITEFLTKNRGYIDCYKQFGGNMNAMISGARIGTIVPAKPTTKNIINLPPKGIYAVLGANTPIFAVSDLPHDEPGIAKAAIKHCCVHKLPLTDDYIRLLSVELPKVIEKGTELRRKMAIDNARSYLLPLYENINTVKVDHTVLKVLTSYVDYGGLHARLTNLGPLFRVGDVNSFLLGYTLGFPVHHMGEAPMELFSDALTQYHHNQQTVIDRARATGVREVQSLISSVGDGSLVPYDRSMVADDGAALAYSPFDVVRYLDCQIGKVVQLTRHKLTDNERATLPAYVVGEMDLRVAMAHRYKLGPCLPMTQLLANVTPQGTVKGLKRRPWWVGERHEPVGQERAQPHAVEDSAGGAWEDQSGCRDAKTQ